MGKHRPSSTTDPRPVSYFIAPEDAPTVVLPAFRDDTDTARLRLMPWLAGVAVAGTVATGVVVAPHLVSPATNGVSSQDVADALPALPTLTPDQVADRLAPRAASRASADREALAAAEVQAAAETAAVEAAQEAQEAAEEAALAQEPDPAPEAAGEVMLSAAAASGPAASIAVETAMAQIGKPYVWGAEGPGSFDCSGLVLYAYQAAGISLPRVSADQARAGVAVSRADLQPGDLVAFYSPVSHIGIYIGDGQMVHAPEPGDVVKVTSIDVMGEIAAYRRVA